jgi:hypothetical protein
MLVQFLVAIDRIQTKQLPYSKLLQKKNSNYKKKKFTISNLPKRHLIDQKLIPPPNVTINTVIVLGSFKPHKG